jgi:adenine C2-methylase RlmN of 23S rRNA A2503 and tRNA A37
MGEPLADYRRVIDAVHRICDPVPDRLGISQRSVTVSTVGMVPAIRKLTEGVSELLQAARGYADRTVPRLPQFVATQR